MEAMKIRNLYNLEETIAAPLLEQYEYPWEVLPHIKEFIKALGNALPEDRFEKKRRGYLGGKKRDCCADCLLKRSLYRG